jgi:hypothetical protein
MAHQMLYVPEGVSSLLGIEQAGLSEEEAQAFLDMLVDGIVTDYIEVVGKYYD